MYKSRLLEFAQKSAIPYPEYHTVNEGHQHAPLFRSSVSVDGKTFTSQGTFVHRKAAEHDAAKLALESLSREIEREVVTLIQQVCSIFIGFGRPFYFMLSFFPVDYCYRFDQVM